MKIRIVAIGKVRDKHLRALSKHYAERLKHYTGLDIIEVREGKATMASDVILDEATRLESQTFATSGGSSVTVAMDEHGAEWTSTEMAAWIENHMVHGTRYITFVIGGAHGMPASLVDKCDSKLALSRMTLPHEMARMLLLEQLYRSMTIIRGEPYHKP